MSLKPRIKIHPNGTCTLSGVNYDDLRSIFTEASLYRYDHPYKEKTFEADIELRLPGIQERNNLAEIAWFKRNRWIVDACSGAMSDAITATHKWTKPVLTLKERLLARDKDRKEFAIIWKAMTEKMNAKTA